MRTDLTDKALHSEFRRKVEALSGQNLSDCYQCGKCSAGCPVQPDVEVSPTEESTTDATPPTTTPHVTASTLPTLSPEATPSPATDLSAEPLPGGGGSMGLPLPLLLGGGLAGLLVAGIFGARLLWTKHR